MRECPHAQESRAEGECGRGLKVRPRSAVGECPGAMPIRTSVQREPYLNFGDSTTTNTLRPGLACVRTSHAGRRGA